MENASSPDLLMNAVACGIGGWFVMASFLEFIKGGSGFDRTDWGEVRFRMALGFFIGVPLGAIVGLIFHPL